MNGAMVGVVVGVGACMRRRGWEETYKSEGKEEKRRKTNAHIYLLMLFTASPVAAEAATSAACAPPDSQHMMYDATPPAVNTASKASMGLLLLHTTHTLEP